MGRKILNLLKSSKIFYIGILAVIYTSVRTGIHEANKNAIMKYGIENNSRVERYFPNTSVGIKYGILTFFLLTILWIFIMILVDNLNKDKIFLKKFFQLGNMSVDNIITKLYYLGFIVVVYWTYMFRMSFSFNFIRTVGFNRWFDLIVSYIITLAVGLILWKIVCELLLVIFRCLEVYYKSKKREVEE